MDGELGFAKKDCKTKRTESLRLHSHFLRARACARRGISGREEGQECEGETPDLHGGLLGLSSNATAVPLHTGMSFGVWVGGWVVRRNPQGKTPARMVLIVLGCYY